MRKLAILLFLLFAAGCVFSGSSRTVDLHLKRASKFLAGKQEKRAAEELDAAINTAPKNYQTYQRVVGMLIGFARYREAADYLEFMLNGAQGTKYLHRPLKKDEQFETLVMLAEIRYKQGDSEAATIAYEKALAIEPNNSNILNNLGYFYIESDKNLTRALSLTKRAVDRSPYQGIFIDSLGWAYYKLGQYEEAEYYLRRAVVIEPNEAEIRYHLGVLYAKWGQRVKAKIELYKAIKLDPSYKLAHAELKSLDNR